MQIDSFIYIYDDDDTMTTISQY